MSFKSFYSKFIAMSIGRVREQGIVEKSTDDRKEKLEARLGRRQKIAPDERSSIVPGAFFSNCHLTAQKWFMLLAVIAGGMGTLSDVAPAQSQGRTVTTSETLGANAREVMIDIFRKKDPTIVDRYFGESFIQHDPSIADGVTGMKSFAAEIASSPTADITIYRTLVDRDFVLLHSKYQGVTRYAGPAIAFDLFRASSTARSLSIGADKRRRRLLIYQAARKSTALPRSLIAKRRRPIGRWYGPTGRRSWSHCASIVSKSSSKMPTMRSTRQKLEMELLGCGIELQAWPRKEGNCISPPVVSWQRATLYLCYRKEISPPDLLHSTTCFGSRTGK